MREMIVFFSRLNERWDVKNFSPSREYGDEYRRLGDVLRRKHTAQQSVNDAPMLSLHFGGSFSTRKSNVIKGSLFVADRGDLVYSKIDLRNGAIGIVPEKHTKALFTAEFPIYGIDTEVMHPVYLELYLRSDSFKKLIASIVSGASGRKRVKPSDFENLPVYAPSLAVQKKIVDVWKTAEQEADRLKESAKEKEYSIDDYILGELGIERRECKKRDGAFVVWFRDLERWDAQFFSREVKFSMKKVVSLKDVILDFYKEKIVTDKNSLYRYVGLENIEKGKGKYKFIECGGREIKSQVISLKKDYFYYSKLRPYLNKVFIFESEFKNGIATSELFGFSVTEKIDRDFLLEILLSSLVQEQIKDLMVGARMPRISEEGFKNLKIPLPPLSKQKEIAEAVEQKRREVCALRKQSDRIREEAKRAIAEFLQ